MVRCYKRKTQRANWSQENMALALKAIKQKRLTYSQASERFGIPRSTLFKRISLKKDTVINLGLFKPTFTATQEQELKEHLLQLESLYYGMSLRDFRKAAFEYAEINGIPHSFNRVKKMAGKDWCLKFLNRVGGLSVRKPEATSLARATSFSKTNTERFFGLLKEVKDKYNFSDDRIFNLDETGVTVVQKPTKIIAQKGKKQVGRITSLEKGNTTTLVVCVSASGTFIPPVAIFKRVRMHPSLLIGAMPGTIGITSKNGWIDTEIYVKVIKHFIQCTRPSPDKPVLLIVDGHSSHKSLEAIEICRANGIISLTLPPHTTNRLQPLDLTVFGPFKTYLNSEMDKWMTNNPGKRITEYNMPPMIKSALMMALSPANITHGFERAGIAPYNPDVFSEIDFLAAAAIAPHVEVSEVPEQNPDITENVLENHNLSTEAPRQISEEDEEIENQEIENNHNEKSQEQKKHVRITKISPLPKAKPVSQTRKKRKQEKAEIITSSPYKQDLEERELQRSKNMKTANKSLMGKTIRLDADIESGPSTSHKGNTRQKPIPGKSNSVQGNS